MSGDFDSIYEPKGWNGILIIGSHPTAQDLKNGRTFCGGYGLEVQKLLAKVGISYKSCARVYAFPDKPQGGDIKNELKGNKTQYKKEECSMLAGDYCTDDFFMAAMKLRDMVRELKPDLVICMGEAPLRGLLNEKGIDDFRGSMETWEGIMVMPTFSPDRIFATPEVRFLVSRDLAKAAEYKGEARWPIPEYKIQINPTYEQAYDGLSNLLFLLDNGVSLHLGVDIETRKRFYIGCIGFAWSGVDALVVPIITPDFKPYWENEQEEAELVGLMKDVLEHKNVRVSGQNYHYDAQYLARFWGVRSHIWCDTMVAHHSCFSGDLKKSLNVISSVYCDTHKYWKDESKSADDESEAFEPTFDSWDMYQEYNGKDCCKTWDAAEILMGEVVPQMGMQEVWEFQREMWWPLLKVMLRGNKYDYEESKRQKDSVNKKRRALEDFIERQVPVEIFPRHKKTPFYNSPTQLRDLFYNVLNIPGVTKKNAKKDWVLTTEDEALQVLMLREPLVKPLCEAILALRSLNVSYNTFLMGSPDYDGFLRSMYKLAGTTTYRLASAQDVFDFGLNLQNLPKGDG